MKEEQVTAEAVAAMGRSVTHEIHLLYTLTVALDAMVFDIDRKLSDISETYALRQEKKKRLNDYFELLRKCEASFQHFVLPTITESSVDPKFKDFEQTRIYSQELIRLIMLYYEQCKPYENHEAVFDLLCRMKGGRGVFSSDDINRFNLGTKKQ